jgi:chromosome segregation ATPase
MTSIEAIKAELFTLQRDILDEEVNSLPDVCDRIGLILQKANDEENRLSRLFQEELDRRVERVQRLRIKLAECGLTGDQVKEATAEGVQLERAGGVSGRSTTNDQLFVSQGSEDKLLKVLQGLRIPDANNLTKCSADTVASKITESLLSKGPSSYQYVSTATASLPSATYGAANPQLVTVNQASSRPSNTSQRASSMGTPQGTFGTILNSTTFRPPSNTATRPPLTERTFGGALTQRSTIGGQGSSLQPVTTTLPVTTTSPLSTFQTTISPRTISMGGVASLYQPQPVSIVHQPTSILTSNVIRQEPTRFMGSVGSTNTQPQPLSTYSNQIRAARPSGQSSSSHYSNQPPTTVHQIQQIRPVQVVQPSSITATSTDNQTTIRELTEQIRKFKSENESLVSQLADAQRQISLENQHIRDAVDKEAHDEQDKLGVMSKEYEAKIDRIHHEEEDHELNHKAQIKSLQDGLKQEKERADNFEKASNDLSEKLKHYMNENEKLLNAHQNEIGDERLGTVKLRDQILKQGNLIGMLEEENKKNLKSIEDAKKESSAKDAELERFKGLLEDTTAKLQNSLEENRGLKQQTQIQEFKAKEIVAQSSHENSQLIQRIYDLEGEIRKMKAIAEGTSPTHAESPVKSPTQQSTFGPFHIRDVESELGNSGPVRMSSSSELINNLSGFMRKLSTSKAPVDKKEVDLLISQIDSLKGANDHQEMDLRKFESNSIDVSQVPVTASTTSLKPVAIQPSDHKDNQEATKFINLMAKYLSEPQKLEKVSQNELNEIAEKLGSLSKSLHEVESQRDLLKKQSDDYVVQVAGHLQKIKQLETESKTQLDEINRLKQSETELLNRFSAAAEQEKANNMAYEHKIAELVMQLNQQPSRTLTMTQPVNSPRRIEPIIANQEIEHMEHHVITLKNLVEKNPSTPENRQQAVLMLNQITDITNKLAGSTSPQNRRELDKVANLINKVSHSSFMKESIDDLADGVKQLKSSGLQLEPQPQVPSPTHAISEKVIPQGLPDPGEIINGLAAALFQKEQETAGLIQQNSQLNTQIANLYQRLKESEEQSANIPHTTAQATPVTQTDGSQVHLKKVAQLAKKLDSMQVSLNLQRMSDQVKRIGAFKELPQGDLSKQPTAHFQSVAQIANSMNSTTKANPQVSDYLGKISKLAQNLSSKPLTTSSVQGSSHSEAEDEIKISEIQNLISQVENIHQKQTAVDSMTFGKEFPEDSQDPLEIVTLKQSIQTLEELLSKRSVDLNLKEEEIISLSKKIRSLEESQRTLMNQAAQTIPASEVEKLQTLLKEVQSSNSSLGKENNQLKSQLTMLSDKVKEIEAENEFHRQKTGASSTYHGEFISGQGKELGASEISNLSGATAQIRPSENASELDHLKVQVADLIGKLSNYEATLKQKEQECKNLQEELKKLKSQSELFTNTVSSKDIELTNSKEKITSLEGKLNSIQESARQIESQHELMKSDLSKQIDKLKFDLTQSEVTFKEKENSLTSKIEFLTSQLSKQSDYSEREKKLQEESLRLQKERETIEKEKREIESLQNQVLDRNESRLRKFSDKEGSEVELQVRVDKLEKDLKEAKDDRNKYSNMAKDFENAKKLVDIELLETKKQREKSDKNWKEKVDTLEKTLNDLRKDLKNKENIIQKIDDENLKLRTDNRSINEELKFQKSEVSRLSQSIPATNTPAIKANTSESEFVPKKSEFSPEVKKGHVDLAVSEVMEQDSKKAKKSAKKKNKTTIEEKVEQSPEKSSQVVIQQEVKAPSESKKSKQGNRKISHNDVNSWMDSENSEEQLLQSYVPPSSILNPVKETLEKNTVSKDSEKDVKKEEIGQTRDKLRISGEDANDTFTNQTTGNNRSPTFGDSQVNRKSKAVERGGKSKRGGRGKQFEDEDGGEFYVKKSEVLEGRETEYREKPKKTHESEVYVAKPSKKEEDVYVMKPKVAESHPAQIVKNEVKTETAAPVIVVSDVVPPQPSLPKNTQESKPMHSSVDEYVKKRTTPEEIKGLVKSQENPYTGPLLRLEYFEGYDDANDDLVHVSDLVISQIKHETQFDEDNQAKEESQIDQSLLSPHTKKENPRKESAVSQGTEEAKKKKKKKKKAKLEGENLEKAKLWLSSFGK